MQSRKALFVILGICLLLSQSVLAGDADSIDHDLDLSNMIPASADLFFVAKDTPNLIKLWEETPFSQLWNDPQVELFFAPLREEMEIETWNELVKEETGYELEQLLAMLTGDLVVYITDIEEMYAGTVDVPTAVFLAEVGDNQELLEELLLRKTEESLEDDESLSWVVEETRGIEMHIARRSTEEAEPEDHGAWAVCNGVLMVALQPEPLVNVISELLDGGETASPIGTSSSFQMAQRYLSEHDILWYLDMAELIKSMRRSIEEEAEENEPVSPTAIFDALRLDNLLNLYLAINLDRSALAIDLGVTFTENQGLAKILAYGPDEATNPTFIPAEATSFGSSNFDIQSAWAELEVVINRINPALLAMAAQQLNAIREGGVELDLRKDLLENLSGEVVMVQMPQAATRPGEEVQLSQPEQVIAFGIRQRQGLELTIETLKGVFGQGSELFTERQFLGTSIYSLRGTESQSEPRSISYAITDDYFLLSIGATDAALEAVLIGMQRPATPVWELDDVKLALAALPAGASGIGYQDLAETGNMFFEMLSFMSTVDEELAMCNPEEMPDTEIVAQYLGPMATGVYKDSNSLVMRARLLPASEVSE
jgi:hypothetical protein